MAISVPRSSDSVYQVGRLHLEASGRVSAGTAAQVHNTRTENTWDNSPDWLGLDDGRGVVGNGAGSRVRSHLRLVVVEAAETRSGTSEHANLHVWCAG